MTPTYDSQIQKIESEAKQKMDALKTQAHAEVHGILRDVLLSVLPQAPADGLRVDDITTLAAQRGLTEKAGTYRQVLLELTSDGRVEKIERLSPGAKGKPAHLFRRKQ